MQFCAVAGKHTHAETAALELAACKTLASQTCEEPHFDRTLRVAFQRVDGSRTRCCKKG